MKLLKINGVNAIEYINIEHITRLRSENNIIIIEFVNGNTTSVSDITLDVLIENIIYKL
jgi:hypothetical protein